MKRPSKEPKGIEDALDHMEELVQSFISNDEHESIVQALGDAADTARGLGYLGMAMASYQLAISAMQMFFDSIHLEVPDEDLPEEDLVARHSGLDPDFMKSFTKAHKRIAADAAKNHTKSGGRTVPEVPG